MDNFEEIGVLVDQPTTENLLAARTIDPHVKELEESFALHDGLLAYKLKIAKYKPFSESEFLRLFNAAATGDISARNSLVMSNARLVFSVAKRYVWSNLPFEDLVQEGNIGLMVAVDRFDPSLGHKFSTYAVWWIRHYISRAIQDKGLEIRLPSSLWETQWLIKKCITSQQGDSIPTPQWLSNHLGKSLESVILALRYMHSSVEALDQDSGLQDECFVSQDVKVEAKQNLELLRVVLESIISKAQKAIGQNPRNRRIFFGYHGLMDDPEPLTLDSLGKEFGLTRERVRQIISSTLKKISEEQGSIRSEDIFGLLEKIRDLEVIADQQVVFQI